MLYASSITEPPPYLPRTRPLAIHSPFLVRDVLLPRDQRFTLPLRKSSSDNHLQQVELVLNVLLGTAGPI